ncbi:Pyruvate decarboxylase 1 [Rhizophlyctis rosea]|uniref:Pyruvate decarboxylase 1 n=1 Tax=Rhizophlyctis rosea TaxID=64517 RepID=A0AAD5X838_9FUNG|nr:Pyruvate decarboxylase 1 [Rhizophlyctis rosea]
MPVQEAIKETLTALVPKGSQTTLGVDMIFGVPGDFNMEFLDQIEDFQGIEWGLNTHELGAGYAADGYARIRGIGAVCTTFGVGELSAVNATAGSYAEMIPVVHIVGTPSTVSQQDGAVLHHTLGNGDFQVFGRMFKEITVAQAFLTPDNAEHEINRVLRECLLKKRPVYIAIPSDIAYKQINVKWEALITEPENNPKDVEEDAVGHITTTVNAAKRPAIILDACAHRFHVEKEVLDFIEASGFPVYSAPMGKGVISDFHKQYRGAYLGDLSVPSVKEELEQADQVLLIGSIKSDFNTGGFTFHLPTSRLIELHSDHTLVHHAVYPKVGFRGLLPLLAKSLNRREWTLGPPKPVSPQSTIEPSDTVIRQAFFWETYGKLVSKKPYAVTVETGTSSFGSSQVKLMDGSVYVSQVLWGSIGFATAAALGVALGAKTRQQPLRTVLITGDGSYQLTATEITTFMRHKLTPIIIIINNDGYTIERYIHGAERTYNRTGMWSYSKSLEFFSSPEERTKNYLPEFGLQAKIISPAALEPCLRQAFEEEDKIHVLEVVMDKMDAPVGMVNQAKVTAKENRYGGEESNEV